MIKDIYKGSKEELITRVHKMKYYSFDDDIDSLYKKDNLDAGYDIYTSESKWIWPFKVTKIKANIAIELPQDVFNCGLVKSRSGMSSQGVFVIDGVIDQNYRGQISCITTRIGLLPKRIKKGTRIAQLLITPLLYTSISEVDNRGEFSHSDRWDNGFGSSGSE